MTYTEPAYAKLNLTLDILGRRPDGYHELRMVMQSIDLADKVTLSPQEQPGLHMTTNLSFLPQDENNLAAKAARRFFEETGRPVPGLAIDVQKRIPVCAGMAGGSSDGAAVLRILQRACAPEMPLEKLEGIGALVGSDVPYCVRGGTVLAEGRGEALTDLPSPPPAALWSASRPSLFPRRSCLLRCGLSACAVTRTPPECFPPWSAGTWRESSAGCTTSLRMFCPGDMPRSLRSRAGCWSWAPWPPP